MKGSPAARGIRRICPAVTPLSEGEVIFSSPGSVAAGGEILRPRVIMPGSTGLNVTRGNTEFQVDRVVFNSLLGGLSYRGRHLVAMPVPGQHETIRLDALTPIPGESVMGIYDYESGECVAAA